MIRHGNIQARGACPPASLSECDEDAREFYEERAAIFQYEAGNSREIAERLAWQETLLYIARRNQGKYK